jgi:hypothetical protein
MIWHRLVYLLLLLLGLGGCWGRSARLPSSPTASHAQDKLTAPGGDDLPTPRLFQIDRSRGASE